MSSLVFLGGTALVAVGLAVAWLSLSSSIRPTLEAPKTAMSWRNLVVRPPAASKIIAATDLGYRARVPYEQGWYRVARDGDTMDGSVSQVEGRAARVFVPPDYVARLPFEDRWQGVRFLDRSAFVLQVSSESDEVEYLARSGRFEIIAAVESAERFPMKFHLAVHFEVTANVGDVLQLDSLFDSATSLLDRLRALALQVLGQELRDRPYREGIQAIPSIVSALNDTVGPSTAFGGKDGIRFQFTGLVIKPREEGERLALASASKTAERVSERIRVIEEQTEQRRTEREGHWEKVFTKLNSGLEAVHAVDATVEAAASGLLRNIPEMDTDQRVVANVAQLFSVGRAQLEKAGDQLIEALRALAGFIQRLNEETAELARAMDTTTLDLTEEHTAAPPDFTGLDEAPPNARGASSEDDAPMSSLEGGQAHD